MVLVLKRLNLKLVPHRNGIPKSDETKTKMSVAKKRKETERNAALINQRKDLKSLLILDARIRRSKVAFSHYGFESNLELVITVDLDDERKIEIFLQIDQNRFTIAGGFDLLRFIFLDLLEELLQFGYLDAGVIPGISHSVAEVLGKFDIYSELI